MKYIIKLMSFILLISIFTSCEDEGALVSDFNGKDPFPMIEKGTSEVSQLAYSIYEDYDLHCYYDLEGDEALSSEYGSMRLLSSFTPIKAEEERTIIVLKLIRQMYEFFSDYREMQVYRRMVLLGNTEFSSSVTALYDKYNYNRDFTSYNIQGTQILSNINNSFEYNEFLTKEMLLFTYFNGFFRYHFSVPSEFTSISNGNYRFQRLRTGKFSYLSTSSYNAGAASNGGFVHPWGTYAIVTNPYADWESFVVWIISRPKESRDVYLTTKPKVKAKYDIVIEKMATDYGMDLEALSTKWQSIGI
ncbi:hypothetical protein [Polaribacter sargassicola]|uniref:hypothetical protein n=1 Tax=Polaribacter sargassicola TaxID=2836891 RepID=UPI001F1FCCC1|nr:hypothetical protein [Polaribacter sp. DS7-9]MCG1037308.1 hypothetical protein [Polaribacter sp. DS7-9]